MYHETFRPLEPRQNENIRAIIFYLAIGTILMLFSYYKTGMVLYAAGIVLYLISILRKRAVRRYLYENRDIETTINDDHGSADREINLHHEPLEKELKQISRGGAGSAEESMFTTNHTKEHEKGEKNVVSE